jgi:hypothetical protein
MKRSIHVPAFIGLLVALSLTAGVLWWLWQRSLSYPGDIRCNHGGHSVFACDTDFGNYATVVVLAALPLIVWLARKSFFTRFKYGR